MDEGRCSIVVPADKLRDGDQLVVSAPRAHEVLVRGLAWDHRQNFGVDGPADRPWDAVEALGVKVGQWRVDGGRP